MNNLNPNIDYSTKTVNNQENFKTVLPQEQINYSKNGFIPLLNDITYILLQKLNNPITLALFCYIAKEIGLKQVKSVYLSKNKMIKYLSIGDRTLNKAIELLENLSYIRVEKKNGLFYFSILVDEKNKTSVSERKYNNEGSVIQGNFKKGATTNKKSIVADKSTRIINNHSSVSERNYNNTCNYNNKQQQDRDKLYKCFEDNKNTLLSVFKIDLEKFIFLARNTNLTPTEKYIKQVYTICKAYNTKKDMLTGIKNPTGWFRKAVEEQYIFDFLREDEEKQAKNEASKMKREAREKELQEQEEKQKNRQMEIEDKAIEKYKASSEYNECELHEMVYTQRYAHKYETIAEARKEKLYKYWLRTVTLQVLKKRGFFNA